MSNPGGLECECGRIFVGEEYEQYCPECRERQAERAYDRSMEEPAFRGGEYAASVQRELAEARKLK